MNEELAKIKHTHYLLKKVLEDNGDEYGTVIINEICGIFNYPTMELYDVEDEELKGLEE